MKKIPNTSLCRNCQHFFITHDKFKPWGCSNFGFKSINLPSQIVFSTTGMKCAYFKQKNLLLKTKKHSKRVGRLA
ncbi:MAG: hypothetical protein CML37_00100 [Rhodobacteraceae bacterium]|nr:hypothetical protein [Paracoccaceae bacterium]